MKYVYLVLKGMGMGAANVIPGVSGGTIALVTGIFEKFINSLKSLDLKAIKLLFTGKFKEFAKHINLSFLIAVFAGIGISIFSLAYLLQYLFTFYPIFVWAYFFGLILASVYFVGKRIEKWKFVVILTFIIGTAVAVSISLLTPATENEAIWYLIICGMVAVCSMILPGLSGSFVLILMGNYQLVMIYAVTDLDLKILLPVIIGAVIGLVAFSHFLSWLFKKYKDQTIALLTGFILGSLAMLWPWKESLNKSGEIIPINKYGAFLDASGNIVTDEIKVFGYNQIFPDVLSTEVLIAIGLMIAGFISIWAIERFAEKQAEEE